MPEPLESDANEPEEAQSAIEGHSATVLLTFIVAVGAFTYLGAILKPLLLALLLFYWIKPPADWLISKKVPPWAAYILLFIATCGVCAVLGLTIYSNAQKFQERFPRYQRKFDSMVARLGFAEEEATPESTSPDPSESPGEQLPGETPDTEGGSEPKKEKKGATQTLMEQFKMGAGEVINYTFGAALETLEFTTMAVFYLLFMILSAPHVGNRVKRALPTSSSNRVLEIGEEINQGISEYIKVKTAVSLGMGFCVGVILYAFGVDYWPLWAFLAFAFNYITYVGSLIACIPPIAVALVQFDGFLMPTIIGVLIGANRLIWIDYVEMRFSGKQLNIDPTLLLLAIAYWGVFWGPLGMVLAVPMLTCLKISLSHFPRTRHWAVLISEK